MTPELTALIQMANTVGLWTVFAVLFWDERKAHRTTRDELTHKLQQAQIDHMNDLREVAGMRAHLANVQRIAADYRAGESNEIAQRPKA